MADDSLFAFAGLCDRWKDASGQVVESCSILTTAPNALLADMHDRMPVILSPDNYDSWLDPGLTRVDAVTELLTPFDATVMKRFAVSTRINFVKNDDPDCAAPLREETSLFANSGSSPGCKEPNRVEPRRWSGPCSPRDRRVNGSNDSAIGSGVGGFIPPSGILTENE